MRTFLSALVILCGVLGASAQPNITMRQLTNFAALKTNGVIYENLYYGGSDIASSFGTSAFGNFYSLHDATRIFFLKTDVGVTFGDHTGSLPVAFRGSSVVVEPVQTNLSDLHVNGIAYDLNNQRYVTTVDASNNVQVVAGSGTIVTASGAGGVTTYTVTSTAGAGATNAVSAIQTNSAIGGLGITSIGFNNGFGNTVAGVSNNGAFTLTFTVDFTPATNYAALVGLGATNLAYIIGANNTNFTYQIGANTTTHVNNASVALTNALISKQDGFAALTELGNSGIRFPGTGTSIESNVNQIFWNLQRMTVATNSSASNLVINLRTNKYYFTATNNITVTNLLGINEGVASDTTIIIEPQLIPRGITYPTLGGASFGIYANTNDNSQMWTTLTNGNRYALTISAFGTNTFWSISRWK